MLVLLILSIILGTIIAGITGIGFLFWVVSIVVFVCGLPGALITGFIHGENEYAQDRADYRESMREIAEDERAMNHELYEDERLEKYLDSLEEYKDEPDIYIDSRQVHFHGLPDNRKQLRKNKKS